MTETIALFSFALLSCLSGSLVSAQDLESSDPVSQPRIARLESSPSSRTTPALVDVDIDSRMPSQVSEEDTPIKFSVGTVPENLDERQAEIQSRVFSDTLRVLGFATLFVCAAIVGLFFYGRHRDNPHKRRRDRGWN